MWVGNIKLWEQWLCTPSLLVEGLCLYQELCLSETPDLEKSLAEMSTMLQELKSLCSLLQESKEEATGVLQREM